MLQEYGNGDGTTEGNGDGTTEGEDDGTTEGEGEVVVVEEPSIWEALKDNTLDEWK